MDEELLDDMRKRCRQLIADNWRTTEEMLKAVLWCDFGEATDEQIEQVVREVL